MKKAVQFCYSCLRHLSNAGALLWEAQGVLQYLSKKYHIEKNKGGTPLALRCSWHKVYFASSASNFIAWFCLAFLFFNMTSEEW